MSFESYLTISMICFLGAITPGPSLAIVVRNTITGGRKAMCLNRNRSWYRINYICFSCGYGNNINYHIIQLRFRDNKVFGILVLLKISFQFLISKELTKKIRTQNIGIIKKDFTMGFNFIF